MKNKQKHIDHWQKGAENDIETAGILITNRKYIEGLFFCHLCIEKILKAHVVKALNKIPPKSHNLEYLKNLTKIETSKEDILFMAVLMKYQLEGRYPEYYPKSPSDKQVKEYFEKSKELLNCLKKKL
ncbi:MAG: HEPN domain-containing protein [Bacteroidetes bacterium]|nr:HEPN domain-containing protein [Bacteroidota bacterium]